MDLFICLKHSTILSYVEHREDLQNYRYDDLTSMYYRQNVKIKDKLFENNMRDRFEASEKLVRRKTATNSATNNLDDSNNISDSIRTVNNSVAVNTINNDVVDDDDDDAGAVEENTQNSDTATILNVASAHTTHQLNATGGGNDNVQNLNDNNVDIDDIRNNVIGSNVVEDDIQNRDIPTYRDYNNDNINDDNDADDDVSVVNDAYNEQNAEIDYSDDDDNVSFASDAMADLENVFDFVSPAFVSVNTFTINEHDNDIDDDFNVVSKVDDIDDDQSSSRDDVRNPRMFSRQAYSLVPHTELTADSDTDNDDEYDIQLNVSAVDNNELQRPDELSVKTFKSISR
ncbi:hypothetical protein HT594_00084 [Phenacoccus solenopsis nudivirus]|nr:hypothetical protein HT594_00084 [Phenacoccus solenopsis nudivirus]